MDNSVKKQKFPRLAVSRSKTSGTNKKVHTGNIRFGKHRVNSTSGDVAEKLKVNLLSDAPAKRLGAEARRKLSSDAVKERINFSTALERYISRYKNSKITEKNLVRWVVHNNSEAVATIEQHTENIINDVNRVDEKKVLDRKNRNNFELNYCKRFLKRQKYFSGSVDSISIFHHLKTDLPCSKSANFLITSKNVFDYFLIVQSSGSQMDFFKKDIEDAIQKNKNIYSLLEREEKKEGILAFQRTFDSLSEFQKHLEKACSFQKEIEKAKKLNEEVDGRIKLNDDLKRNLFKRMKSQNYRASLKLEGLDPSSTGEILSSLESIKAKYVG